MPRRTPQEKKQISYKRDRRNCYGENSKSSRTAIPLQKAKTRRAYRKRLKAILSVVDLASDSLPLEVVEERALSFRRREWKKVPDRPLAEHIAQSHEGRARRNGGKKRRTYNAVQMRGMPKRWLGRTISDGVGFTAVLCRNGKRWIGWVKEVPGINGQGRTRDELVRSLCTALLEANENDTLVIAAESLFQELDEQKTRTARDAKV